MNWNEGYRTTITKELVEGLQAYIAMLLQDTPESDDDKLLLSVLAKIKDRLYQKMVVPRREYQMTFSPTEALALRILFTDYVQDATTQLGNRLHTIAFEVNQKYN